MEGKTSPQQHAIIWSFDKNNNLVSTSELKTKPADKLRSSQVRLLYFDKIITEDTSQSQKDLINSDPFRKIAVGSAKSEDENPNLHALFWHFDNQNNEWLPAEELGTLREDKSGISEVSRLAKVGDKVILFGKSSTSNDDNNKKLTATGWVLTPRATKRHK